jgi:Family of unknown function (DUF5719)
VDHAEAGVVVRRLQTLVAILVPIVLIAGAAYAQRELTPRSFEAVERPESSGAWFCPHGGGPQGWEVQLQVANPGTRTATIRVRPLGQDKAGEPETLEVEPGSFVRVPVPADGRGSASVVEWFGQWVAVGWLAHAGGEETGVAAEPCAPAAGQRWLLPDGVTETEDDEAYLVVMNPFAREAVFSVTLLGRREPVQHSSTTDVALKPFRSTAFRLGEILSGEPTVAAIVEVSVGRVAAASLGVTVSGGIRSALGYLGTPPTDLTFPGGDDAGSTQLPVMNASPTQGGERVSVNGDILGQGQPPQAFAGLAESSLPPVSARTFPATTSVPSSIRLDASDDQVAAVRRTFGTVSDQAAVTGATPASSWVVLPTVAGSPSHAGLVLANPGTEPAEVTLSFLSPGPDQQITVTVPPQSTATAPQRFLNVAPEVGVLATASSGTFVPASASYSLGIEGFAGYAVALGIPIAQGAS